MEYAFVGSGVDALVFHGAGVAATGGVDRKAFSDDTSFSGFGFSAFSGCARIGRRGRRGEGLFGQIAAGERLVTGAIEAGDLGLGFGPGVVYARLASFPDNIKFCHS